MKKRKAELISKDTPVSNLLFITNPRDIPPDLNVMDVQDDGVKLNTHVFFSSITQHKTTNVSSYSIPTIRK